MTIWAWLGILSALFIALILRWGWVMNKMRERDERILREAGIGGQDEK
jgi:hypothetical protein